jgi:hypothetical protein
MAAPSQLSLLAFFLALAAALLLGTAPAPAAAFLPSGALQAGKRAPSSGRKSHLLRTQSVASTAFSLSLADDTRIVLKNFDKKDCRSVADNLNLIIHAFQRLAHNAEKGGNPYKEESVEFSVSLDSGLTIEMECNPNLFPDPFKAEVFVKVMDGTMEVSSTAGLTKLVDTLKAYLAKED